MTLPFEAPIDPMLAKNATKLPVEDGWIFEPKWDGFRCLVFRDGDDVQLWSRSKKSLTRYFPELLEPLRAALPDRAVVDGEIILSIDGALDFDALSQRIHPADSRVQMLAGKTPTEFVAFDVLAIGDEDLRSLPFGERRTRLEALLGDASAPIHVTPATSDAAVGRDWFNRFEGAGLDGVIGKPIADPYAEGKRTLLKLKHQRTADVVVAGYRIHKSGDGVGSLILGLYDDEDNLHHIGVASSFTAKRRVELLEELSPHHVEDISAHPWRGWLEAEAHEDQRMPGAPSRWAGGKDASWIPLDASQVAEVTFNQLTAGRLRHPAKFLRWRGDREATSCGYHQLDAIAPEELRRVLGA